MTIKAYARCITCGGRGWYYRTTKIGSQEIDTPTHCNVCNGKGEILMAKVQPKPLFDKYGRPIDTRGRVVRHPNQENEPRRERRKKIMREMYGKENKDN